MDDVDCNMELEFEAPAEIGASDVPMVMALVGDEPRFGKESVALAVPRPPPANKEARIITVTIEIDRMFFRFAFSHNEVSLTCSCMNFS